MTSSKKIQNPKTQLSKKSAVNDSDLLSCSISDGKKYVQLLRNCYA